MRLVKTVEVNLEQEYNVLITKRELLLIAALRGSITGEPGAGNPRRDFYNLATQAFKITGAIAKPREQDYEAAKRILGIYIGGRCMMQER